MTSNVEYIYHDETGAPVLKVTRKDTPGAKKEIRQHRYEEGGYKFGLNGLMSPPWRLPEVLQAAREGAQIIIAEGEKCVEQLEAMGLVGTTNAGGAGKWRDDHAAALKGARVAILPDNDPPGQAHAQQVAASLCGIAKEVKIVALPGLPVKGDIVDWVEAGGTKEELLHLVAQAPHWSSEKPWPAVLPLSALDLPSFPTEAFPDWLREWVEAEAVATQTPFDLAAFVALCVVATAVQGVFRIQLSPNWCEAGNLWTLVSMPSGSRKSVVARHATQPVENFERELAERLALLIRHATQKQKILQAQLERKEKQAVTGKATVEEVLSLQDQVEAARAEIPREPRLIVSDITPESLVSVLAAQGGCLSVYSTEGEILELLGGRYSASGSPIMENSLKAFSGDPIRVDRRGREPEHVPHPRLTLSATVQPDVICGLASKPGFRGRGLLARFFYSIPPSPLGSRSLTPPPVPHHVAQRYETNIRWLLELREGGG